MKILKFLILNMIIAGYFCNKDWSADMNPEKWNKDGLKNIKRILNRQLNGNVAKNIILFLGDGMGMPTVTAGRILKGQKLNNNGKFPINQSDTDMAYEIAKNKLSQLNYFSTEFIESDDELDDLDSSLNKNYLNFTKNLSKDKTILKTLPDNDKTLINNNEDNSLKDDFQKIVDLSSVN